MNAHADAEIIAAARAGFLDEAADMLDQFEAALLVMESNPRDADNLNAAFRAAHTIKGTAGLFGCDAVVLFTHEVETLLEGLRNGSLLVDEQISAALLAGRDQMQALIDEVRSGGSDPAVAARSQALGAQLRRLYGGAASAAAADAPAGAPASVPGTPARDAPEAPAVWHLSLRFGADALRNGLDPLAFVRYLSQVGQVLACHTLVDEVPPLEQLGAALQSVWLSQGVRWSDPPAAAAPGAPAAAVPAAAPAQERRKAGADRRGSGRDRRAGDEARFVKVRADKLDHLIDLIGELVIAGSGAQMVANHEGSPAFLEATQRVADLVQATRDGALALRMVPVGETFQRFQRVVRDTGKQLGKEIEFAVTGGDTELDKSMVEVIADPLMHLVRNSLDHGIETPAERAGRRQARHRPLTLNAYHEAGAIVIEVIDDGRGLHRDRILAKAIERGLVAADASLQDQEVWNLIFAPGFSTADKVTDLSGRGVGMDVVQVATSRACAARSRCPAARAWARRRRSGCR
jgi:two-component system chemotaxis sensor kinase CheA